MYKASEAVDLEVKSGTKITVNTKVTEAYENGLTTDYVFVTNYDEVDLATVAAVYVDNKLLADTNYTVANKEITVKSAFLNKLTHGEHSFELRFNKGANPTADVKFNVVKDPQGPPSIKQDDVTNESYEGLDDGKIPGLTTGMEYRKETSTGQWTEWTKVTDEDMTFEAGKYEVRNADTDTQAPSNSVEITVGAGEEIKVTASKTKFIKGDKEGLVFTVNVDYDVKTFNGVKINGNLLPTNMYSVAKGSTIVTLPAVNLELLNAGTYNIAICYKPDVEVTSTFTVEDPASGNTGGNNVNPSFACIGTDDDRAVTLNGKTTTIGKLTSCTLSNGIKKLSFNYTHLFSDTKFSLTINIKDVEGNVVATKNLDWTAAGTADKYTVDEFVWELETPVQGDFVIEIVNNCPSNSTSNKDRATIWNLTWLNA
jgi:hypothetical protein